MSRLTKYEKNVIVEQETIRKFNKDVEALKQEVLKEVEKQQEAKKPKWMTEEIEMSGYIERGNYISWPDKEPFNKLSRKENMNYTSTYFPIDRMNNCDLTIEQTKTLIKKVEAFNSKMDERRKFKHDLETVLSSMTTWKSLVSAIPEFKEYEPQGKSATALVPVESIQKIRKQLKR